MHDLWRAYKRPSHGQIHETRRYTKAEIKHVIRNKKLMNANNASNDLLASLLVKETNILSVAMTSSLITKMSASSVKSNSMS